MRTLMMVLVVGLLAGSILSPTVVAAQEDDEIVWTRVPTTTSAETMEELLAAPDYNKLDAATLRLYRAFLNREPDIDGVKYWIQQTAFLGASQDDLAYGFGQSAEFLARYGQLSNEDFLGILYDNMLGREPDAEGFDYWLGQMNDGTLNQSSVVRWIVANDEFIDRFPYAPTAEAWSRACLRVTFGWDRLATPPDSTIDYRVFFGDEVEVAFGQEAMVVGETANGLVAHVFDPRYNLVSSGPVSAASVAALPDRAEVAIWRPGQESFRCLTVSLNFGGLG